MKSQMAKVLAVDCVYEGGRMFVGAVSVVYLLNLGYSASTVALLKMVQAIVVLIGEFPSGVISDYFGRKLSLLGSLILASLGFLCFLDASLLAVLIIGETLLALSMCLWSGTYEAWALEVAKIKEENIKEFFHVNGSLNQFTVLTTGLLGGLVVGQAGLYHYAYFAALLSMVLLLLFLIGAPEGNAERPERRSWKLEEVLNNLISDAKNSISIVLSSRALLAPLVLSVVMQFSVQPMLHYWQPLVSNAFGEGGIVLGVFFGIFCGGSAIVNWLFRKSKFENSLGLLFCWLGLLFVVGSTRNKAVVSVALVAAQVSYFFLKSLVSSHVATLAPSAKRASVLNFASLISRAGMFVSLLVISLILETFAADGREVRTLYLLIPGVSVLGLLAMRFVNKRWFKERGGPGLQRY